MRIAFIDSWIQSVVEGSGTAAGIGGLQRALLARGHTVARLAPPRPWPRNLTLRRLLFNMHLPALLRATRYDLVVGFDIDGFRWSGRHGSTPYLASIKGVIAEEMQHEGGRVRALFELLSRLEGANARAADAVLTTSDYCRRAIERHYGVAPARVRLRTAVPRLSPTTVPSFTLPKISTTMTSCSCKVSITHEFCPPIFARPSRRPAC